MNAVDTNVLVYAVSCDESVKGPMAMALLDRLSAADTVLLGQVACEFAAAIAKLRARGQASSDAFAAPEGCRARFPLVMPSPGALDVAIRVHREDGVSFWDAMLLAACADAGADTLYSEEVQSRPVVAGVRIINPFAASAAS
jgi:predicted nucleic acid-binding protein